MQRLRIIRRLDKEIQLLAAEIALDRAAPCFVRDLKHVREDVDGDRRSDLLRKLALEPRPARQQAARIVLDVIAQTGEHLFPLPELLPRLRETVSEPVREPERPAPGYTARSDSRVADKVVNLNSGGQLKVVLVAPKQFELAAEIADHLRDRRAVLMNLEQTDKNIARRLIDFLSGVAYAQDGKIRRVASATYIITPFNVDLMGDQLDDMESGEFHL